MTYPTFPCPKCSTTLEASGELDFEGRTYPVYQCDSCIVQRDVFGTGELTDTAYTFYVKDGVARNPADDED
jgi:hypothetical protein